MKQIAICRPSEKEAGESSAALHFLLQDQTIFCNLVKAPKLPFRPAEAGFRRQVVVQKTGFFCNYRDQGWILHARESLEKPKALEKTLGVGSDFVGVVVATGEEVETLQVGDRVISNSCYPPEIEGTEFGIPSNQASARLEVFHEYKLMKIPDAMPDEVAAGFTVGAQTAYAMIKRMNIKSSDKVLLTAGTSNTSLFILNALQQSPAPVYVLTTRAQLWRQLKKSWAQRKSS